MQQARAPKHFPIIDGLPLNTPSNYLSDCQIGVSQPKAAKNLVKVEIRTKEAQKESTNNTKGQIISFSWHLKKNGKRETTIETYTKYVQSLSKYCNLNNPESVKLAIATHFTNQNTKRTVCTAYDTYAKFIGIK